MLRRDRVCSPAGRRRQAGITHEGEGVCSDSSSVDNKALAVNVLLPGMLQGHNLLQMLEAGVQLVVVEGGKQRGVDTLKNEWERINTYTTRTSCIQPTQN